MKLQEYTDSNGFKRCTLTRDGDSPELGIPCELPGLPGVGDLKRALNNELISRRLFNWADVMIQQGALTGVAKKIGREYDLTKKQISELRREIIHAYKQRR